METGREGWGGVRANGVEQEEGTEKGVRVGYLSRGPRVPGHATVRYDTRCYEYFNVRSKADISQLNLPHGRLSDARNDITAYRPLAISQSRELFRVVPLPLCQSRTDYNIIIIRSTRGPQHVRGMRALYDY